MESARESRAWARSRVRVVFIETLVEGLTGALRLLVSPFTAGRWRRRIAALLSTRTEPFEAPPRSRPVRSPRVFIVAGEPSGDQRAADLVLAARAADPGVRFEGYGGPKMEEAGVRLHARMDPHPVMGFVGVAREVRTFVDLMVDILVRLWRDPPDALVLVDYPGFNLRLARAARPLGIPTVEYVAPQVWAWAPWRIATVARSVDWILAILPFEPGLFAGRRSRAVFTGHPLLERLEARAGAAVPDGRAIGLLPGSRRHEVECLFPLMLATASRLRARFPDARFVVPAAGPAVEATIRRLAGDSGVPVEIVNQGRHELMASLRTAMVASGTATLELALLGVPMVVVYPLGRLQRWLRPALLIAPHFALVNVAAGREVVEERFVGTNGSGDEEEALAASLARLHEDGPDRERQIADLRTVREGLAGRGAAGRAARALLAAADQGERRAPTDQASFLRPSGWV